MSVATLNTKATGVVLTPEEELTFAEIVEAGFNPAPNTSVDLSGFDPDKTAELVATATTVAHNVPAQTITWHGPNIEVTYVWPPGYDYKAWCQQTEEEFALQRRMIVDKYLELDYTPLDTDFKAVFVERLRASGHRQCQGIRRDGSKVCAMGLADEIAGYTGYHLTGLTSFASDAIIAFNDIAGWTFAKIADWVERKL